MATTKKAATKAAVKPVKKAVKTSTEKPVKKTTVKLTDAEAVNGYMEQLVHPLKAEVEAVRTILKSVNKGIGERIKWNAPSYYYKRDLVTFNLRTPEYVHLIFHDIAIVDIKSDILLGDYKDRRMVYLHNMKEVKANKKELERIMQELVKAMDAI